MSPTNEASRYLPLRQNDHNLETTQSSPGHRPARHVRVVAPTTQPTSERSEPHDDDRSQAEQEKRACHRARRPRQLLIWRFELVCCIMVLGAFSAIVATLLPFEHKRLPQWKYGLTLNTLVSIYVVILRASMLVVASQCLSHLKWLWFRGEHKLLDFASYDEASRGPLGSLKLLWKLRTQDLVASVGGFITVATLIIDPFAQQALSSYSCVAELKGATASLNRANSYIREYYGGASGTVSDLPMQKAINAGIYNPGSSPPFECKTGNCTFATPYHTLGYCSACTDLTSQLVASIQNFTYLDNLNDTMYNITYSISLPPDVNGDTLSAYLSYDEVSLIFSMDSGQDIIAAFTSNSTNLTGVIQPGSYTGVGGARCSLEPCIRTCTATVNNFALEEKVISTTPLEDGLSVDKDCLSSLTESQLTTLGIQEGAGEWPIISNVSFTANGSYYFIYNSSDYTPSQALLPPRCIYGVNFQANDALSQFLDTFLTGNITATGSDLWDIYGPAPILAIYNMSWVTFESIEATFRNISDSITTQIRVDNSQGYYADTGIASEPVLGQTWENRICVRVKWGFLAYPAAIIVLALAFFIATVSHQKDSIAVDWKSSQLALLFHGLHQDTMDNLTDNSELGTVHDMEVVAKEVLVSLRTEGSHLRLRRAEN